MSNFKASLFVAVGLISTAFTLDAQAVTRVTPVSQTTANQPAQGVADAAGPTTGGGDTPYLSVQPTKPDAEPAKPADNTLPQAAAPAPAPAAAEATPATPTSTEKSQETQPVTTPVPAATPVPQPAQEQPVQASTPPPAASETPVPAPAPQSPPGTPVQAATPAPAAPPQAIAIQPQVSQPPPVLGAQDQKPKQQLAKKKPKPVRKPDVVVRDVPKVPLHRTPDDTDTVYEDGPVPPMPIGRHRVVIEADNGYDGDYVVVRHYHPCERHFVPGFWFFHREERCY